MKRKFPSPHSCLYILFFAADGLLTKILSADTDVTVTFQYLGPKRGVRGITQVDSQSYFVFFNVTNTQTHSFTGCGDIPPLTWALILIPCVQNQMTADIHYK